METVRDSKQQMKPNRVISPIPEPLAEQKEKYKQDRVERKKIRSQGDNEIAFADDDMPALARGFELFY